MKKLTFRPSFLQILYLIIYSILFFSIISTPILIRESVYLSEKFIIDEEIAEGLLLGILFFLSILILNLYKREDCRQKELIKKINNDKKTAEEKLFDSLNYIGKVNVQIQEIKSIFNNTNKYPETKNDFKKAFRFLGGRVLEIVNTNWVLFRIINSNTRKTITECFETRRGFSFNHPNISNKIIIEKQLVSPFSTVIYNPQNLNILVCCVLPVDKISQDERTFIRAIVNEIIMLFVILDSSYYKNGNKTVAENKTNKKITEK